MSQNQLLERVIGAHGGAEIWQSSKTIKAVVSARGLAFTLKRRPFFKNAAIELKLDSTDCTLLPIGRNPSIAGKISGANTMLLNKSGDVIETRENSRSFFPAKGKRLFKWDDLDMAYFANYAFWNYFTFPRLLLNHQIKWTQIAPNVLQAEFSNNIPTHNQKQQFYFDEKTGLLLQHNYTAQIISNLAKAANRALDYKTFNGIPVATRRIVTPQGAKGKALKNPVLIDIEVHEFELS